MEAKKLFAVVGTDARQAAAGRVLERAGYAVGGAEQVALADYILLPLPLDAARTPLAELLRAAKPGAVALGGRLSVQAKTIAQEAGVELVDYFARPELTVYNAIPTAEGCIGILLAERTRTLWGTNLLLLGFGPVGQALGARLAALGLDTGTAAPAALPAAKHIFTHIEWLMSGVQLHVPAQSAPEGYVWANREQLRTTYTLPGAFRAYKPLLL